MRDETMAHKVIVYLDDNLDTWNVSGCVLVVANALT